MAQVSVKQSITVVSTGLALAA